ncbi:MAG TPA: helix-turn-helix transcriptional regulator [Actinomycetota bacterium]
MSRAEGGPSSAVVEAGVHRPGLMRRHADRVLPVHELIVVQAGVLPIAEEDRRFEVRRDEWVALRAGRRHFGDGDLDGETWFYWVCFGEALTDGQGAAIVSGRRTGTVSRPGRVRAHFEHLLEDQHRGILSTVVARSYVQLLLAEIRLPATTDTVNDAVPALAKRASAFVREHLIDPDLSTTCIASALACSPDYLGRTFRGSFDETLTEHIHRLRIERALTLFRSTGLPLDRVAAAVGFGDVRYFRRIFKRRVGLTPGQFRRLRPLES